MTPHRKTPDDDRLEAAKRAMQESRKIRVSPEALARLEMERAEVQRLMTMWGSL
jgi:hypothetical protein